MLLLLGAFAVAWFSAGRYAPDIAPPPSPVPNAYVDYKAAAALLDAAGGVGDLPWLKSVRTVRDIADEEDVVRDGAPALARLRQGFAKQCQAPAVLHSEQIFPELHGFLDLARLLAVDADVRSMHGDWSGACADGMDGVQLGMDIARGGCSYHARIGLACQAFGSLALVRSVDHLSPAEAGRAADRLQRLLLGRAPFTDTVRAERRAGLSYAVDVDRKPSGVYEAGGATPGLPPAVSAIEAATSRFPLGVRDWGGRAAWHFVRDRTLLAIDGHMRKVEAEAAKPAPIRRPVPAPRWQLALGFLPDLSAAQAEYDRADARARLLLIALRLRAYQGTRAGALPGSLDRLGIEPRLLVDPYSDRPLVYKPKAAGYLLYSVGPDLKDDGGVPVNEEIKPPLGDLGVTGFSYRQSSPVQRPDLFRRVPHMVPPKLPPGAPPLNP